MDLILRGDIEDVTPIFDPDAGYTYCPALRDRGIYDCEGLEDALRELAREGILKAELYDKMAVCSRCGSHRLIVKPICPYCGSIRFERITVLEHLPCGYSGPERDFMTPAGDLVCPKCGKKLKAIGVDYIRTAGIFHCLDCGELFSLPGLRFVCANCGKDSAFNDLRFLEVYRYRVVPEKVRSIKGMAILEEAATKIARESSADDSIIFSGPGATVKGVSGMNQEFTYTLRRPDTPIPLAVIDVVLPGSEFGKDNLLKFFAKAFDANAKEWILVVPREIEEKLREAASRYGIKLVVIDDPEEIPEKIMTLIRDSADGERVLRRLDRKRPT